MLDRVSNPEFFGIGIGLLGAALTFLWPNKRFIGWSLFVAGIVFALAGIVPSQYVSIIFQYSAIPAALLIFVLSYWWTGGYTGPRYGPNIMHGDFLWGTYLTILPNGFHKVGVTDPLCPLTKCQGPLGRLTERNGKCSNSACGKQYTFDPVLTILKDEARRDAVGQYLRKEIKFDRKAPNE